MNINTIINTFLNKEHLILNNKIPYHKPETREKVIMGILMATLGMFSIGILPGLYLWAAFIKSKRVSIASGQEEEKVSDVAQNAMPKKPTLELEGDKIATYDASQVGKLIDSIDTPEDKERQNLQKKLNLLIPEQMREEKMEKANKVDKFDPFSDQLFEKEDPAYGVCGMQALNNAFGKQIITQDAYFKWIENFFKKEYSMEPDDNFDFDIPPERYQEFLNDQGFTVKKSNIAAIVDFPDNKENALINYIGDSKEILIVNNSGRKIYLPSRDRGVNPLMYGHVICARKDKEGTWWLIDSAKDRKVPLKFLSILHKDLDIFVLRAT